MSRIETFKKEKEAIDARDHYNHNLKKRSEVFKLPGVDVTNYGGGDASTIFNAALTTDTWVLVVEN